MHLMIASVAITSLFILVVGLLFVFTFFLLGLATYFALPSITTNDVRLCVLLHNWLLLGLLDYHLGGGSLYVLLRLLRLGFRLVVCDLDDCFIFELCSTLHLLFLLVAWLLITDFTIVRLIRFLIGLLHLLDLLVALNLTTIDTLGYLVEPTMDLSLVLLLILTNN
jgi:hypothetical protein